MDTESNIFLIGAILFWPFFDMFARIVVPNPNIEAAVMPHPALALIYYIIAATVAYLGLLTSEETMDEDDKDVVLLTCMAIAVAPVLPMILIIAHLITYLLALYFANETTYRSTPLRLQQH